MWWYMQIEKDVIQWNLPKAEVDNSLRDLHNSSRYAKLWSRIQPFNITSS